MNCVLLACELNNKNPAGVLGHFLSHCPVFSGFNETEPAVDLPLQFNFGSPYRCIGLFDLSSNMFLFSQLLFGCFL